MGLKLPEGWEGGLIGRSDLESAGVAPRKGATPAERYNDLFERYLSIPNKMMIFYTSEDEALEKYIRNHWNALDGLSGEVCDVFPSLLQLHGDEDAYDQIGELGTLPGASGIALTDLPAILLWSDFSHAVLSLKNVEQQDFVRVFRYVFSDLRQLNGPIRDADARRIIEGVRKMSASRDSARASIMAALFPLFWSIPLVLLLPIMIYYLNIVGSFGSIVIFFFLLLLYGLVGAFSLKAQGKLADKEFVELVGLVYSTSLAGLKDLLKKWTGAA
jgi:hypothetical protein